MIKSKFCSHKQNKTKYFDDNDNVGRQETRRHADDRVWVRSQPVANRCVLVRCEQRLLRRHHLPGVEEGATPSVRRETCLDVCVYGLELVLCSVIVSSLLALSLQLLESNSKSSQNAIVARAWITTVGRGRLSGGEIAKEPAGADSE